MRSTLQRFDSVMSARDREVRAWRRNGSRVLAIDVQGCLVLDGAPNDGLLDALQRCLDGRTHATAGAPAPSADLDVLVWSIDGQTAQEAAEWLQPELGRPLGWSAKSHDAIRELRAGDVVIDDDEDLLTLLEVRGVRAVTPDEFIDEARSLHPAVRR